MNDNNRDWDDQDSSSGDEPNQQPRKEPELYGFDDEALEEPDRDTDFNTIYSDAEENDEADEFEAADHLFEDKGDDTDNPWPGGDATTVQKVDWSAATAAGLPEDGDDDEYWDEEDEAEDEAAPASWPLGMIVVAVIALVLLAAGGYGVMEQRAGMQEEIRRLQAELATSATPEEVAASREAVAATERRNTELQSQVDTLNMANRGLRDTVAGLEAQLQAQTDTLAKASAAAAKPAAPKPAAKPKPAPAPKPAATPAPTAAVSTGNWFVNFGSYGQKATAESWTTRLQPPQGKVVVTTGSRDGRTFYRVRVINLPNRAEAENIARQLEKDYSLERLWVGQE